MLKNLYLVLKNQKLNHMKNLIIFVLGMLIPGTSLLAQLNHANHSAYQDGQLIKIGNPIDEPYYTPLTEIKLTVAGKGLISVYDAYGNEYFSAEATGTPISFKIGGALGGQMILLRDKNGKILDKAIVQLDCKTSVNDEKGEFKSYFNMVYNSMAKIWGDGGIQLFNGKSYKTYDGWFQDNVHTFKGMKYFDSQVKDFVDLFADGQKDNGMIYDNYYGNYNDFQSWFDRFGPEFVTQGERSKNSSYWCRIPIENEPEFSFLEAVYFVWKATGDDAWMKKRVENCIRAIHYTMTDPYRWSDKFQLTKRAYTIDIWDFQCKEDASLYRLNDVMKAELGKTRYGISYADNIGMAIGCEYVSEMLTYLGSNDDAVKYHQLSEDWRKKTDDLCWNGHFYRMWVPEDTSIKRDFGGTDETKLVSLNNTYCMNRRMPHDKAVEIIKTYQRIREEMPKSSPGEWYLMYPPYEKGWHIDKWEYMNGGVSPVTAGELAHGAYENGYEDYATDILRRVCALADKSGEYMYDTYKGALAEKPVRNFSTLSLKAIANADFKGDDQKPGVNGWTNEDPAINDMINFPTGKQVFHDIPFDITNPSQSGGKACVVLSAAKEYPVSKTVAVNAKAASIYLVHAKTNSEFGAYMKINYSDGTFYKKNIVEGTDIAGFWYPNDNNNLKVAWKGPNRFCKSVGMYLWGYNNPNPDKIIRSIDFVNDNEGSYWMIAGLTISDYKVWYDPGFISYGLPPNWPDAAVIYAMVEGLAGVKDMGITYNKINLAPRWESAGINSAEVSVRYEASKGYVAYKYKKEAGKSVVSFTSNSVNSRFEYLLGKNTEVKSVRLDGTDKPVNIKLVELSKYLVLDNIPAGVHEIEIMIKF